MNLQKPRVHWDTEEHRWAVTVHGASIHFIRWRAAVAYALNLATGRLQSTRNIGYTRTY